MVTPKDWAETAKALLKAELKRRGVSYRQLAEKLTDMGTPETERNIANKLSRGGFTAAFFLQCLAAIGCENLRLDFPHLSRAQATSLSR
ncbi:MAG: DUF6471 domain-containing protein [Reyranellaceae bacterium]